MTFELPNLEPSRDKKTLRRQLQAEREGLIDRHQRAMHLQEVLRVWLLGRQDLAIGAYWPIKGEFDALPALYRWAEADNKRCMGLPVVDKQTKRLSFQMWFPGCEMEDDAYGIPKPKGTPTFEPTLLLVPCVGFGPKGVRLGYGGGFFDRTLRSIVPRPLTVGVCFTHGFLPMLRPGPTDFELDALVTEDGIMYDAARTDPES